MNQNVDTLNREARSLNVGSELTDCPAYRAVML